MTRVRSRNDPLPSFNEPFSVPYTSGLRSLRTLGSQKEFSPSHNRDDCQRSKSHNCAYRSNARIITFVNFDQQGRETALTH